MSDKKLGLIRSFSASAAKSESIYMWYAIPGGIIIGKPTDPADWMKNLTGEDVPEEFVAKMNEKAPKESRLIFLKDVLLRQGRGETELGTAIVDARDVSAWGYHPKRSDH